MVFLPTVQSPPKLLYTNRALCITIRLMARLNQDYNEVIAITL